MKNKKGNDKQLSKHQKKTREILKECNYVGRFELNSKGFGFVMFDQPNFDGIYVSSKDRNGAISGDKVLIRILPQQKGNNNIQARVVKILERKSKIVGEFHTTSNTHYVKSKVFGNEIIRISEKCTNGAQNGDLVVVKLLENSLENWYSSYDGYIEKVLGNKEENGVDVLAILEKYGVSYEFSKEVMKEVTSIKPYVTSNELVGRQDFRNVFTITMDGETAKDFDDAITIEKLSNGNFMLGVHIADVSHYVKQGTELDKEALNRGVSMYLSDRCIPMLPKKLSTGICSLNPGVDRLTMSLIMEIDSSGEFINSYLYESVINSNKRTTYEEIQMLIDGNETKAKENEDLLEMISTMKQLKQILESKRKKRGAIEFPSDEPIFLLDDNGNVQDVYNKERNFAMDIIKEFMIVANECIAQKFFKIGIPMIYRVHENPRELFKLQYLEELLDECGISTRFSANITPKDLSMIMEKIRGTSGENAIALFVLGCLRKAKYTTEALGHFGLAIELYCRFTSPIRSYADLEVHRLIKKYLKNEEFASIDDIENIAKKLSETERIANQIKEEVDSYKMAQFMKSRIGKRYDGIIYKVFWGEIHVKLENTVEGIISLRESEKSFSYQGDIQIIYEIDTNKTYTLGQKIRVEISKVDIEERKIYMKFVES